MTLMKSWVESANAVTTDFPLNNLPCGVFSTGDEQPRCGVAIGNFILDISALEAEGLLKLADEPLFDVPFWNELMEAGPEVWADLRAQVTAMLAAGASKRWIIEDHLVPLADATLHMPFLISEYTDFYAGRHHATNVGTMFRGAENALPPNWLHIPIGYNGRASSVVVSGTEVRRPWGQLKSPDMETPIFAPSQRFDIELEMGAIVGQPSELGYPVSVAEADAMIFGYVLLNDWSARDIQAWEYQPLGPFQAKATATSISPWIVMKAALEPFRAATPAREVPLLPHLQEPGPMLYNIALEVGLTPEGGTETVISRTNYAEMYYSAAQQLAHHTTSGCAMNVGDLLGSGTISGPTKESRGSLLELSWGGKEPFAIAGGTRSFIEDNDTLTLRGAALGDGYRIGFGTCTGKVIPALKDPWQRR
ncbi:MAG: fumarylacetoacetase [Rhodobacteraceae bacterium]|uniref:fumarylacetoacetase n=1 Tax=Cypionkella sp. TaxID=2811411 RepID=UPI001324ACCD|nr:fumarylacetoacetase [Cypionkella sp.]KAF0174772.1 MAG: fumarylacetoacetase [Paracoccaceae bacterium]MDO8327396.1 fumarylacetoacetase [Cypionkella sp.]